MKQTIVTLLLFGASFSLFSEEKDVKTSPTDLVCKQLKIIAGDDSKMAKLLESMTNGNEGGSASNPIMRCENSTSICYVFGNATTCHKK